MRLLLLLCVLGAILPGCRKRPGRAVPESAQPAAQASQDGAPTKPEAAAPNVKAAPPNPEKDLAELTLAVKAYYLVEAKLPSSLDDLVKARCIYQLPTPPPGRRYAIDAKKMEAVLVNQ
ncbi:MAG: hypothetical protein HZA92_04350 [Verrucomicrobia bacterium]|nr:hypothetical protein [Verrucomicrobiota bacterium]